MRYLAMFMLFILLIVPGCRKNDQQGVVFELKYGLYDDFDGNGCLQTYNNQGLAEAGLLNSKLWRGEGQVVNSPNSTQGQFLQIYDIVNEKNELLKNLDFPVSVMRWVGAQDLIYYDARIGLNIEINKGQEYGRLEIVNSPLNDTHGKVAQITYIPGDRGAIVSDLIYPEKISYQDYQSCMADVMITTDSTLDTSTDIFFAGLSFAGSLIPQGGGYWESHLHVVFHRGVISINGLINNKNTGYSQLHEMPAQLDRWYNLKMDIVILSDTQFRVDYYVDGSLLVSITPLEEDCKILLDPNYAGYGPIRGLVLGFNSAGGRGFGHFDNVHAVYTDQVQ